MAHEKSQLFETKHIFLWHWPENTEKHWLSGPETGLKEARRDTAFGESTFVILHTQHNILNEIPQKRGHEIKQFALQYNIRH